MPLYRAIIGAGYGSALRCYDEPVTTVFPPKRVRLDSKLDHLARVP